MYRQKGEIGLTIAFFLIAASLVSTVAVNTIRNFNPQKKAVEVSYIPLLNVAKPSPSPAYTCSQLCLNTYRTACVSIGTDKDGTNGKFWNKENIGSKREPEYQCVENAGDCNTSIIWLSNGITCSSGGVSDRAQWTVCRCLSPQTVTPTPTIPPPSAKGVSGTSPTPTMSRQCQFLLFWDGGYPSPQPSIIPANTPVSLMCKAYPLMTGPNSYYSYDNFQFRYQINNGSWQEKNSNTIPGLLQWREEFTFPTVGNYKAQCIACSSAQAPGCTSWGPPCEIQFSVVSIPSPTPTQYPGPTKTMPFTILRSHTAKTCYTLCHENNTQSTCISAGTDLAGTNNQISIQTYLNNAPYCSTMSSQKPGPNYNWITGEGDMLPASCGDTNVGTGYSCRDTFTSGADPNPHQAVWTWCRCGINLSPSPTSGGPTLTPTRTPSPTSGGPTLTPTRTPTQIPGTINPYTRIEAESYIHDGSHQSGVVDLGCSGCSADYSVGQIVRGDWIKYDSLNFNQGTLRFVYGFSSPFLASEIVGNIQVRLDSLTGTLLADCTFRGTESFDTYIETACNTTTYTTGTHNIYITFTSDRGDELMNFDYFYFETGPTLTPTRTPTITPTRTITPTVTPIACKQEGVLFPGGQGTCCPTPGLINRTYEPDVINCDATPENYNVCVFCGNGVCGPGETGCKNSCPSDCPIYLYVSPNGNDQAPIQRNGCRDSANPCKHLNNALWNAYGSAVQYFIKAATGTYSEIYDVSDTAILLINSAYYTNYYITVSGGYDPTTWTKTATKSVIDGLVVKRGVEIGTPSSGNIIVEDFEIKNGTPTTPSQGGGIYVSSSSTNCPVIIRRNNIHNNNGNVGAAIHVSQGWTTGNIIVQDNKIYSNTATGGGGSIINCSSCSSIESNEIYSNTSSSAIIRGQDYMNSVKNNLIYGNTITAGGYGPIALSIYKSSGTTTCPPVCTTSMISNNTIDNNTGGEAVVYVYFGLSANTSYDVYAKNNLISNHGICDFKSVSAYSVLHYAYNLRYLNPTTACAGTFNDGENNSTTINPYIGSGNYHLNSLPAPTNAAKDAGANLLNETPPAIRKVLDDIDGQSRPIGSAYDIGADEYSSTGLGSMGAPASPTPTKKPVPSPTKKPSAWINFWNKMIFRRRL